MLFFWLLLIFSLFHRFLAIWVCMFWCDFVFILLHVTNFLGLYFSSNLENIWPAFLQISLRSYLYFLPLMIQLYIFWLFDLFHRSLRFHPLFFESLFSVLVLIVPVLCLQVVFFLHCQTYLDFFSSIISIWFF